MGTRTEAAHPGNLVESVPSSKHLPPSLAFSDLRVRLGIGKKLTLRVKVPRKVAESLEAVYIGVSRDYGGVLWYLEDAAKIESSLWQAGHVRP